MSFDVHWDLPQEDRKEIVRSYMEMKILSEAKQHKWNHRYLSLAEVVSHWSDDIRTNVGAVIATPSHVISLGYNGFPRGVEHMEDRQYRPYKYDYFEHAERNAIYNALNANARLTDDIFPTTIYLNIVPWSCPDCARAIIQCGITRVVGTTKQPDAPGTSILQKMPEASLRMFEEAGVAVWQYDLSDPEAPPKVITGGY